MPVQYQTVSLEELERMSRPTPPDTGLMAVIGELTRRVEALEREIANLRNQGTRDVQTALWFGGHTHTVSNVDPGASNIETGDPN